MHNKQDESRLNLLLVDDDHGDLALMGLAIEQSDTNIWLQTACDTQRAIDYLEGRDIYADRQMHPRPDVILLDLDMPLSSGFDFLDWLRTSPSCSPLPILLLSATAYQGAIQAALSMGANAWCSKPLQIPGWISVIDKVMELHSATLVKAS